MRTKQNNPDCAAWRLAMTLVLTFCAGCFSSAKPYVPDLVPVVGTITYNGNPVASAIVAFHPAELSDVMEGAWSHTDAQGRFSLSMQDYGSGAVPGEYAVTVMSPTGGIPEKYKTKDSTPLRATVEDTDENEIPLVLED